MFYETDPAFCFFDTATALSAWNDCILTNKYEQIMKKS